MSPDVSPYFSHDCLDRFTIVFYIHSPSSSVTLESSGNIMTQTFPTHENTWPYKAGGRRMTLTVLLQLLSWAILVVS